MHVVDTEPYAWPYDGRVDGAHLALVAAGWDESWADRSTDPGGAAATVASLAAAVVEVGGAVVVVAHGAADPGPQPTPLPLGVAHRSVTAAGIDGFWGSPLDAVLRADGRTHLLVVGHGIEGPVHSTLRSANDRGYECLLVVDACSALTTDLPPAAAKTVTMSGGIFGAIGRSGAVLAALAAAPRPPDLRSEPAPATQQEGLS